MYMDYLPEWKIYLWKKLILNKDGEFDGKLTPDSFRFFTPREERDLIRAGIQKSIDIIKIATESRSLIDFATRSTASKDSYFHFDPSKSFLALVELTNKPATLEITNIRLDKKVLTNFKDLFKPADFGPEGYAKVMGEKELTLADLGFTYFDNYSNNPIFSYLTFEIKIDKAKLQKKLSDYLNNFTENKLSIPMGLRYIDPKKQLNDILSAITRLSEKYGSNMVLTSDEVAKAGGWYLRDEHHYRFYESLITLEKDDKISIGNLRKNEVLIALVSGSIQDKKLEKTTQKNTHLYITKDGDDFRHKGRLLKLSKKADYYKVFCSLYALIGNGGEIDYTKLGREIQSRVPKTKRYGKDKLQKFIQTNLTDRSNGFMHYGEIPDTEDNGRPLVSVNRGTGIVFNNRVG